MIIIGEWCVNWVLVSTPVYVLFPLSVRRNWKKECLISYRTGNKKIIVTLDDSKRKQNRLCKTSVSVDGGRTFRPRMFRSRTFRPMTFWLWTFQPRTFRPWMFQPCNIVKEHTFFDVVLWNIPSRYETSQDVRCSHYMQYTWSTQTHS